MEILQIWWWGGGWGGSSVFHTISNISYGNSKDNISPATEGIILRCQTYSKYFPGMVYDDLLLTHIAYKLCVFFRAFGNAMGNCLADVNYLKYINKTTKPVSTLYPLRFYCQTSCSDLWSDSIHLQNYGQSQSEA